MKTPAKKAPGRWMGIVTEKCPKCGQGHVFESGTGLFSVPVMKERCEVCQYRFEREPGYFLGAMYISYAIAVFLGILTFLVMYFLFPGLPLIWTPITIMVVVLLVAKKNFKVSRLIYMHIFPW